jgi:DNA-binding XRE family transcriptional regulator
MVPDGYAVLGKAKLSGGSRWRVRSLAVPALFFLRNSGTLPEFRKSRNWRLFHCVCNAVAAMSKELRSPRHDALRKFLKLERVRAELKQGELAERLGWNQRTLSDIETGAKRVTVLELVSIAEALGFDPSLALRHISEIEE